MPALINVTDAFFRNLTGDVYSILNRTNDTSADLPIGGKSCNETALTAGSAAFILIALILGCMTQPEGSLVTHTGNRFWRVSPFLNLLESSLIYFWLLVPSVHEVRTIIGHHLPNTHNHHIPQDERSGDMSLKVAAYTALVYRLSNARKHDLWARQQYHDQEITFEELEDLIREVQSMEQGATLRPAIVLPMVLQFFKIVFIQSSFAWKMWPLIYFFSWFGVELLLLIVHGSPLTEREIRQVELEIATMLEVTETQGQPRRLITHPLQGREPAPHGSSTDNAATTDSSVTEQSQGLLLANVPAQRSPPKHRVFFQGKRRSLKTMRGNPSMGFVLIMFGRIAIVLESYLHMMPILLWVNISSGWHIALYMFLSLGPLVLLDIMAGFLVVELYAKITRNETMRSVTPQVGMRDLVAFKTSVIWLIYYLRIYTSEGMVKPAWLDWLG